MQWCEQHGVDYIFGFAANSVLQAMTEPAAEALALRRVASGTVKLRRFATLSYGARHWDKQRRLAARIEATDKGLDVRYVVSSLAGTAKHLYERVYCARGQTVRREEMQPRPGPAAPRCRS